MGTLTQTKKGEGQALRCLRMVTSTKENGTMINQMARGNSGIRMVTTTRGFGRTAKPMARDYIPHLMAQLLSDSGTMTSSMAKAKRHGQILPHSRECMPGERRTGKESTSMQMGPFMMETGVII